MFYINKINNENAKKYTLFTSEPDVYRRQILTYIDDPRAERIKVFLMAVDP